MNELELMQDLKDAMDAKLTTYDVIERAKKYLERDALRITEAQRALDDYRKEHNIV